jgi:ADP-ribose pyrophosphatase YjhB (NUDIX family)
MEYWQKLRQALGHQPIILSGAAGAIIHNGKILLVHHKDLDKWQVPGGLQELGEIIQQTIEREIKEELNLDLKASQLISVFSHPKWNITFQNGDAIQQLSLFFLMEGEISEISPQTSEVAEYRFFDPDEIPENTLDCCKQKVKDWKEFQGKVNFW